jgi:Prealbumin-like fold domain
MTERVLGPSGSKLRKTRLLVLTALAASAFAVFFVAASSANLPSSPTSAAFEDNDGNLVAGNSGGTYDWNGPVPETITCSPPAPSSGTNCGLDLTGKAVDAAGNGDNALGQGSKEDDTAVSLVDGSIPPSKDDLQRFYVNKQFVGGKQYLYLAWERTNLLGSAHLDFEFNQVPVGITPTSLPGNYTLSRSPNDLLIDFDFGGSGQPALVLHKWLDATNAPTGVASADCEASNTFPCWSAGKNLSATGFAEGAVNAGSVSDTNNPAVTLDGNTKTTGGGTTVNSTFGEAGINLTDSGAFPPGSCETLGSAWVKSRSSGDSFVSELKDIIAPIPVHISNCGEIRIVKHSDPRGQDQVFGFNSTIPNPSGTITSSSSPYCQADTKPNGSYTGSGDGGFALNDSAGVDNFGPSPPRSANILDCINVQPGTYTVTEGADPGSFSFTALSCSATGTGTSASQDANTPKQANITIAGGGVATCTYTNQLHQGAILITKLGKYKNCSTANAAITVSGGQIGVCGPTGSVTTARLGGAAFRVSTDQAGNSPVTGSPFSTSNTTGTVCIDGLSWSGTGTDYWVAETGAPTGYSNDNSTGVKVTVTQNATCNAGKTAVATGTGAPYSATDTPLTNITVSVASVRAGATNSSVSCVISGTTTNIGNSRQPASGRTDPVAVHADGTNSTNPVNPGIYVCTIDVDP